ncbi:dUTP diphosphatase [Bradyrhizobium uaiense]|uniref:dUTP diphosphatase n=1 Tax=Bradyrhizobium uaiense TaxID=2594946 RepID=A0A6P1BAC1_9BRAD|nr:dUTP diphosphatase [Bradyrhizobium uaiense]NEU95233.1 dUTP diphosphatase [Bradyrhizobium uaiense]
MKLQVKVIDPRLENWGFPRYGSSAAAGVDLFACIPDVLELKPGASPQLISSGIALNIPDERVFAVIVPRSGLAHSEGLVLGNSIGVIDPDYKGACMISAWNRNPPDRPSIFVRPGDRIAQMIFLPFLRPEYEMINEFSPDQGRGDRGFGSSGVGSNE